MAKRVRAHRIGDAAEQLVKVTIGAHDHWMARNQNEDYGIDLEAELAEPDDEDQNLLGKLIKLQIKGRSKWRTENNHITVRLEKSYLDYVCQFRLPVILVAVELKTGAAWYIWLQDWVLRNELELYSRKATRTVLIPIPTDQTLGGGLDNHLRRIARGEHESSLVLALRELAIAAASSGNIEVFKTILDLVGRLNEPSKSWITERIIDALIGLGPHVGLWRSSQLVPYLFAVVDNFGPMLTEAQINRMVAREGAWSRAAIYALSRLYDKWGKQTMARQLPEAFLAHDLSEISWYCKLREHYNQMGSFELWQTFGAGGLSLTEFGSFRLPKRPEEVVSEIYLKWPNRGDSIYLDYLEKVSRAE